MDRQNTFGNSMRFLFLASWQTFQQALRLSQYYGLEGPVHTTGSTGGFDWKNVRGMSDFAIDFL